MADVKPNTGKTKIPIGEIGESGTLVFGGIITNEEYNSDLTGSTGLKVFDKMRRGDATVAVSLRAMKLPILAADYTVEQASDDPKDIEVATFVEHNLLNILPWHNTLEQILTHLDFGFSLHEMVFEPMEIDGVMRIALTKLAYRKQTSIWAWIGEGGQPGVTQVTGNGDINYIPEEKLANFVNQKEGDNYQGISVLRSAYKHWFMKDKLYQIEAVAVERHSLGIIEIIEPPGATNEDRIKVITAARQARANQESYIKHPPGWTVQFMDMKAHSLKDPQPMIAHHDRAILVNTMTQFLSLGARGSSGARATSQDHSRLFELSLEAVANNIVNTINKRVIPALVDMNFNVKAYPALHVGKIGDEKVATVADAMEKFVSVGAIHPLAGDENYFRSLTGMQQLTDDEEADLAEDEAEAEDALDKTDTTGKDNQTKVVIQNAKKLKASIERNLYGSTRKAA